MSEESEAGYGILMPFVSVVSKGGVHDDESYTCGWEMGSFDAHLKIAATCNMTGGELTIHTSNVGQADLIAMKHGFTLERSESEVEGWTFVQVVKNG